MSSATKRIIKPIPKLGQEPVQQSTSHVPVLPKHLQFPELKQQPEFLTEFMIFVVTSFAMCVQFLQMYKTVWWLPDIPNKQAVNFFLINKQLVLFILVVLGRKFFGSIFGNIFPKTKIKWISGNFGNILVILSITIILGHCIVQLIEIYSLMHLFCLVYPLLIYPVFFGLDITPFLNTIFNSKVKYLNGMPYHCCSINAKYIRAEAFALRLDFNHRFKQIIYSSIVIGYYAGFVPLCFANQYLYFDKIGVVINVFYIWLSAFSTVAVQCLSPKYCDILHRSALHLGNWSRIEAKTVGSFVDWNINSIYSHGTVVKHDDHLFYKCEGPTTTVVPGEMESKRFHFIFKNPTILYLILLLIQLLLIGVQFVHLMLSDEWHVVIGIGYLIVSNFYTLFILLRNFKITHSIYSTENAIFDSQNSTTMHND